MRSFLFISWIVGFFPLSFFLTKTSRGFRFRVRVSLNSGRPFPYQMLVFPLFLICAFDSTIILILQSSYPLMHGTDHSSTRTKTSKNPSQMDSQFQKHVFYSVFASKPAENGTISLWLFFFSCYPRRLGRVSGTGFDRVQAAQDRVQAAQDRVQAAWPQP